MAEDATELAELNGSAFIFLLSLCPIFTRMSAARDFDYHIGNQTVALSNSDALNLIKANGITCSVIQLCC